MNAPWAKSKGGKLVIKDPDGYLARCAAYEIWRHNDGKELYPPNHYAYLHYNPTIFKKVQSAFMLWYAVRRLTR